MTPSALDVTAVDLTAASPAPGSICAVELVRVRDGAIVTRDRWLVVPPTGPDDFDPERIRRTGVTPEDAEDEGLDWVSSLQRIDRLRGGSALLAPDDREVRAQLRAACRLTGLPRPEARWADTAALVHRHLGLELSDLAGAVEHLGLPELLHPHDAAERALACAQIALELADRLGARDLESLLEARTPAPALV